MSIIWTLRKHIDSIQHREEEAARQRDRDVARRQGVGDGDDEEAPAPPAEAAKQYECRVCGRRSTDGAYCPDCLAETMVEVPGGDA